MDRVPPAHPRGGRTEPLGKIADHARWAQGATNRGRSREDKEWIRGTARLTPMRNLLTELLGHLNLERIEENLFRGQSQDLGWGRVFGGQILAQALSAARACGDQVVEAYALANLGLARLRLGRPDPEILAEALVIARAIGDKALAEGIETLSP